jgi:hypothetical protein
MNQALSSAWESAMSFKLFVYYCAVGGGWCGFVGWGLSAMLAPEGGSDYFPKVLHDSVYGLLLGFAVAFGLSLLDGLFNHRTQPGKVIAGVFAAILIGAFSGLFGAFLGSSLHSAVKYFLPGSALADVAFVVGWTVVGLLIGFSISVFEVFRSLTTRKDFAGSFRKLRNCVIGGTAGGILGGIIAFTLLFAALKLFGRENLLTPTALGFIAIGACIGLLVGLAQIILKEAWIKVEAGFRPGRELIIAKEKTTIGRAEGSDIALFGDSGRGKAARQYFA